MGTEKEKRQQKMVILSMVKHCAIPELPSPDTTASSKVFLLQGRTDEWRYMYDKQNKLVLVSWPKKIRLEEVTW